MPSPETSNDTALTSLGSELRHELARMQQHWWWFLILGAAWILLGLVCLSSAVFTTNVAVALFGFLMFIAGIAQIVTSFWAGRWSGTLLQLLVGILYAVVGYIVFQNTPEAAAGLTLLIAGFLLIGGIVRIVVALSEQFNGWGWVLLNGAVATLLGFMIFRNWPISGLWVIGLYIGIEMIFNGWYWVMLAFGVKSSPKIETEG
jgi:uncharacterized membrane protein HdeD (DUF308 family)